MRLDLNSKMEKEEWPGGPWKRETPGVCWLAAGGCNKTMGDLCKRASRTYKSCVCVVC